MLGSDVRMVYLHDNLHLMEKTAMLINSEWPRSMTARLRSLNSTTQGDVFPVSVLLVSGENGSEVVVGYSKASLIPTTSLACFVESVVIAKDFRGKGFGRLIMKKTEEYTKHHGMNCIYLTTQNEAKFYAKLGYELCPPILFWGSLSSTLQQKFHSLKLSSATALMDSASNTSNHGKSGMEQTTHYISHNLDNPAKTSEPQHQSAPAPPPPPAPVVSEPPSTTPGNDAKLYMKKLLN